MLLRYVKYGQDIEELDSELPYLENSDEEDNLEIKKSKDDGEIKNQTDFEKKHRKLTAALKKLVTIPKNIVLNYKS